VAEQIQTVIRCVVFFIEPEGTCESLELQIKTLTSPLLQNAILSYSFSQFWAKLVVTLLTRQHIAQVQLSERDCIPYPMVDCESTLVKIEYIPFAHGNPLNGDQIWLFSGSGYLRPSTECNSIIQRSSGICIPRPGSAKYCSDVENPNLTCLKCPFLPSSPRGVSLEQPFYQSPFFYFH
jgi:hypothetical protein